MTVGRRYLLGLGTVAAAALLLGFVVSPAVRSGLWFATGLALIVQGPLGWRLVRALGSERLLLIWAIGMAARFSLVVVCALLVAPWLGIELAPLLLAVVSVLMCCVAVEAIAALSITTPTEVR